MVEGMASRLAALYLKSTLVGVWFTISRNWPSLGGASLGLPGPGCPSIRIQKSRGQYPGACWQHGLLSRLLAGGQIRPLCLSDV